MTQYAKGGLVTGPDPTPIFTETLLAQPCGYMLSPRQAREIGAGGLAILNVTDHDTGDAFTQAALIWLRKRRA